jgi:hypothetical protein
MGKVLKSRPRQNTNLRLVPARDESAAAPELLAESAFHRMIAVECKRAERSGNPCLLMLLDPGNGQFTERKRLALNQIAESLPSFTRETDVTGWYKQGRIMGVIFTEINAEALEFILKTMLARLKRTLSAEMTIDQLNQVNVSFEMFPEKQESMERGKKVRSHLTVESSDRRETPSVS